MGDQHRLDLVIGVFGQPGFERSGIDRIAVGALEHLDLDIRYRGVDAPDRGEPSGLGNQHLVASRQGVRRGHLPATMAVTGDDETLTFGLGDTRQTFSHDGLLCNQRPFVQIRHRLREGREHPVRDDRRSGNGRHLATPFK